MILIYQKVNSSFSLKERRNNVAGTMAGGKHAAETNKLRHGKDFYAKIGAMGGKKGHTGGFAANPELARYAGRLGGMKSKRGVKMSDKAWTIKRKIYYCRTRIKYFENKLQTETNDYAIQYAENSLEHWQKQLKECEQEFKKEEK